jgi:hypothetical protein
MHSVTLEKSLKQYEDMPLPKVTCIKIFADIFPEKQTAYFKSLVTIKNKTAVPIKELLLDGDNLTEYSLKYNQKLLSYTCPVFFARGKFNFFGPAKDSSGYRLYQLPEALHPGDTALVEINSSRYFNGFTNNLYGANFLHNGTVMGVALPGLGYDDDEEIRNESDRKKYGLPVRQEDFPGTKEAEGANILLSGKTQDLISFEITVSTSAGQTVIAPGNLENKWQENGRNYFRYTCNSPGIYTPQGVVSAEYAELHDSVLVGNNRNINIDLFYHPSHNTNLQRFVNAYRDGLKYYSDAFGAYPFRQMRLVESTIYAPGTSSMAATDIYAERFGWNADFTNNDQFDYCYFTTARQLAKQWWGNQVAPNHTKGAELLTEGLSKYSALVLYEKKYGKNKMKHILNEELNWYLWNMRWNKHTQDILLHAGNASETDNKAGIVLYGLKDLEGEENINTSLREFKDSFAFKTEPPYAGAKDLYHYIKKHVPDSLQYYLTDTWEKITFFDNRIIEAKAVPAGKNNQYKVTLRCSTSKTWADGKGNDIPAPIMNDYIDIAVFGEDSYPLYMQKHRLTAGEHLINIIVTGKPLSVGIDPYLKLIDRIPEDNVKKL